MRKEAYSKTKDGAWEVRPSSVFLGSDWLSFFIKMRESAWIYDPHPTFTVPIR
ncbi:hypothetical protein J2S78_003130 [Salibacterium salarium]|nr:hypothetical protein [Salibacterium salarium]